MKKLPFVSLLSFLALIATESHVIAKTQKPTPKEQCKTKPKSNKNHKWLLGTGSIPPVAFIGGKALKNTNAKDSNPDQSKTSTHTIGTKETSTLFPPETHIENYAYPLSQGNTASKTITEENGIVVILFHRIQCSHCKNFAPTFKALDKEYALKGIIFRTIRFSDNPHIRTPQKKELTKVYGIPLSTFPCILITKNGEKKHLIQGHPKERQLSVLRAKLNQQLAS